jgi:predicted phosphodiesterase
MTDRYLVLGDHHGDTESLRRVLDDIEGERFDFVVHVGDFTDAMREDREAAATQLQAVEPYLDDLADHARHDLVWVYGNRDLFGDFEYDLDVGTQIPDAGRVTVGGQQFTNAPDAVDADTILVTHMETWRLVDHFDGLAHFCGNTHLGRQKGRRLNSAFLQYTNRETGEQRYGGYFVVEVDESPPFDIEMREIGTLDRFECPEHGERGVQFHAAFDECMYCTRPNILWREMCASAFYGLTHDSDRNSVADAELVDHAVGLWDDTPTDFRSEFAAYLGEITDDRYAPLTRTDGGDLTLAEKSYAY